MVFPKSADYGQNGQKQPFVRKFSHNGQKFTDKSPENDGLSVKCVLITDKCSKNGSLSVKFE